MKHLPLTCLTLSLAAAANSGAQSVRTDCAEVAVIDRNTGAELGTHYYHGEYWVAGRPGARYAVEIRNLIGGRLLAVTSVDGVNVISSETAAWDQTGYVFAPRERYQITGWRKSDSEVAAFTFTASPDSYAERTGRPANVGVIGVALFREWRPEPVSVSPQSAAPDMAASADRPATPAPLAAPAQPAPLREARSREGAASAPKLGTGHGEREYSYVGNTQFERLQPAPNAVIRIHYDSLENLIAMGIVPRWRVPGRTSDPFPGSGNQDFVPDPPG